MFYYLRWSFLFTFICLMIVGLLGWNKTNTLYGFFSFFFICLEIIIFEISLSFDNAIINAKFLTKISKIWQKIFLTWGMIISVFIVRIILPIFIIMIFSKNNFLYLLYTNILNIKEYSNILLDAKTGIYGFSGSFLFLTSIKYFTDDSKSTFLFYNFEKFIKKYLSDCYYKIFLFLIIILFVSNFLNKLEAIIFIKSSFYGFFSFVVIEKLNDLFNFNKVNNTIFKTGLNTFFYLEFIDATFSLDSVICAFALSDNIIIISIGLCIGAFYVRSITIYLIEKNIISSYKYLENGAFYSILILSISMFLKNIYNIPDIVTDSLGLLFIIFSLFYSFKDKNNII